MGWKTDLIVIDGLIDRNELLGSIRRSGYLLQRRGTCEEMFPPSSLLIGTHSGCTLVGDPELPMSVINQPDGPDAQHLVKHLSQRRFICCILHSVVNLAGFSLYQNGTLVRRFAVSGEDGLLANEGQPLDPELKVIGQYRESKDDSGELLYLDTNGESYTLDALGEDIVFEVISTLTGKRPDFDAELFDAPADIYSRPSLLRRLFGGSRPA